MAGQQSCICDTEQALTGRRTPLGRLSVVSLPSNALAKPRLGLSRVTSTTGFSGSWPVPVIPFKSQSHREAPSLGKRNLARPLTKLIMNRAACGVLLANASGLALAGGDMSPGTECKCARHKSSKFSIQEISFCVCCTGDVGCFFPQGSAPWR